MPTYQNRAQYGKQDFEWDPSARVFSGNIQQGATGYLPELLGRLDRQRRGEQLPWYEAEDLAKWEAAARAIPTRDISSLTAQWQGEDRGGFDFDEQGNWRPYDQQWWSRLDPGSPDAGPIMLSIRDKMQAGTATEQERALYDQTLSMAQDWNTRASVPQASDANPFGLGDQLFGALMTLGIGSGMAGLALLAAGTITAGSLGAGASTLGSLASLIGPPTGQEWLTKAGQALGLTGTLASLPTLLSSGVHSLSDAARLASAGGRLTRGVGALTDNEALNQAGDVLGAAGALGRGAETLSSGVTSLTDAAKLAQAAGQVTGTLGRVTGNRPLQQVSSVLGMAPRLGSDTAQFLAKAQQAQQAPAGVAPLSAADWLRLTGQREAAQDNPAAQSVLWNL